MAKQMEKCCLIYTFWWLLHARVYWSYVDEPLGDQVEYSEEFDVWLNLTPSSWLLLGDEVVSIESAHMPRPKLAY